MKHDSQFTAAVATAAPVVRSASWRELDRTGCQQNVQADVGKLLVAVQPN